MKKLIFCILAMMLFLIYACSVDEMVKPEQNEELSSPASNDENLRKQGVVVTVNPTGTDDTQNIVQAFEDAKNGGPGSTVKLLAGQYIIGFIEILDFDGFLEGAGQGITIISNLPDLPCEEELLKNSTPSLFTFIGGNVTVNNLTFKINDGEPCAYGEINESFYGDLMCILIFADYGTTHIPENRYIIGSVINVDFIPGIDYGAGTYETYANVAIPIYCGSDFVFPTGDELLCSGEFNIKGCNFQDCITGPDLFGLDENSIVNIENCELTGSMQQIFLGGLFGTKVNIKNNKFENGSALDLFINEHEWQSWGYFVNAKAVKSSEIVIMNNEFDSPEGVMSIYLKDCLHDAITNTGFPSIYTVKHNTMTTQSGGTGIYTYNIAKGFFGNNKFYGSGTAGIIVDGNKDLGHYGEYNSFLACKFYDTVYDLANIVLTEHSRYNVLKGACMSDNVIDEGTNNFICDYQLRQDYGERLPKDLTAKHRMAGMRIPKPLREKP